MENLDKFDVAILQELQSDGRLSNVELAQRVGLSAAPCWRRVKALEDGGYISGYYARINRHKVGLGVLALAAQCRAQQRLCSARTRGRHCLGAANRVVPLHQRHRNV